MSKQIDPIVDYKCDSGRVSKDVRLDKSILLERKIGEFADVYCVAKGEKKLAALDFSAYGKKKFRKLDTALINKVIQHSNSKNIKALHNKKKGGMYLKTVFFEKKNYKNALRLMDIFWNPNSYFSNTIKRQIAIGLLLGYSKENISYFIEKNYNTKIGNSEIKFVNDKIKKMNVSLDDLREHSDIVLLDTIDTIKI